MRHEVRKIHVSVPKGDSAYVYCILESHDHLVAYSTLDHQPGDPDRKLELLVTPELEQELRGVLELLVEEKVLRFDGTEPSAKE